MLCCNALIDAGAEVEGVTYIKYTRPIKTEDAITDACISDDQTFHVVYAMGQLPTDFEHIPGSALETFGVENVYNQQFYKEDELKFHGGGIGSGSDRRGTLGSNNQQNLFMDDASRDGAAGCTPSTLDGFDCMLTRLGGNSIIHYKAFAAGDTGAQIAAETPSESGWVAFGFHPPGQALMSGSTAVIATDTAASGGVGVFDLNGQSAAAISEAQGATAVAGRRRHLLQSTNVPFTITDVRLHHHRCITLTVLPQTALCSDMLLECPVAS